MPKISIIIPTYNRKTMLPSTLNSILSQTINDYEIIIVDDGSTDNTSDLINEFADKIIYIKIEHSGLPAKARNIGIRKAKGEYIAFLDSDDVWLPPKLEKEVYILDKHPNIGLVCSNAYILETDKTIQNKLYLNGDQGKNGKVLVDLLKSNFIIASSVIIRRSILDKSGIFSENPLLRALEDYYLWLKVSSITDVCYIPDALLLYRDHTGSIRGDQTKLSYINAMIYIMGQIELQILYSKDKDYRRLLNDIKYNIALYKYDRSIIDKNKNISYTHLVILIMMRPRNIFNIYKFIKNSIKNKEKVPTITSFISPWTN